LTTPTSQPSVSRTIFRNASVFDGESRVLRHAMNVLVVNDQIAEVTNQPIPADGADVVDCTGKVLMPGLIDNHVHVFINSMNVSPPEPPMSYRAQYANKFLGHILSCGFTSVRDVAGGDQGIAMALRDGLMVGPRYFYGGPALSQTGGHADFRAEEKADLCPCCSGNTLIGVIADGEDECRKAAREQLRKGANHIKIIASGGVLSQSDPIDKVQYTAREISAIVEECDQRGVYACAHCHPAEAVRRCVECGVRCIEHGTLIDAPTAAFAAEKGAFIVPTMAVIFAMLESGPQMGLSQTSYNKLLTIGDSALKGLEIMKQEGVKMGFGTDLLGPQHTRQGTEFTLRKQVLSAADILISATSVNADILQLKDKLGVVKKGAYADLLVVDGNPLDKIELLAANGAQLTHIMLKGGFVKRPHA
jgi:imidazolonepropionase-like amidohydrolase